MKTALVCIAKNEDYYIEEWLKYNFKLGFDEIIIFQNNWRYKGVKSQFPNAIWYEADGDKMQLIVYSNFLKNNLNNYDWIAFFDIDEFLVIKNQTLKNYLLSMDDTYSIGINWKFFGSNNLNFNGNYNVLERFTKCQKDMNVHIKTIVHCSKIKQLNSDKIDFYHTPHHLTLNEISNITVSSDKKRFIHGPFNNNYYDDDVQLNHYYFKTLEEFELKCQKGRADVSEKDKLIYFRTDVAYDKQAFNEVEDLVALKFFNS